MLTSRGTARFEKINFSDGILKYSKSTKVPNQL